MYRDGFLERGKCPQQEKNGFLGITSFSYLRGAWACPRFALDLTGGIPAVGDSEPMVNIHRTISFYFRFPMEYCPRNETRAQTL